MRCKQRLKAIQTWHKSEVMDEDIRAIHAGLSASRKTCLSVHLVFANTADGFPTAAFFQISHNRWSSMMRVS